MSKNGKTYRGQRVQKSYKIGCGCFYCTGTDKEARRLIEEKRIDKEAEEIINNVDLYNVSKSFYCDCLQPSMQKPISETEYECFDCGKEVKQ